MTGKAHGVWAIPSQWWFCSSFQQFWIYVPPFLLGQEFQVPVIHYWRTESKGQTNLSFALKKKKKSKNLSWQQGNSALAFLPYSGLNNINEMQPLSLARKITEKITECLKHWVLCNVRKPSPFIQLFTKPLQAAARCPSGSGLPRTHLCSLYWKVKVWADLAKLSIAHVSWAGCHLLFLNGSTH